MAVRKKSETIHLRVQPLSKLFLEGLANIDKTTSTRIIENLILEAAKAQTVDVDDVISDDCLENEVLTLNNALEMAFDSRHPILTKLRINYLACDALSFKDKMITLSIIINPELFSGDEAIFSESEGIIKPDDFSEIPRVSLNKIETHTDSLEKFAEFREKNPMLKIKYKAFLKLAEENNLAS